MCFAAGGSAIEFPEINYGACCYAAGWLLRAATYRRHNERAQV
jgi:hypothetical protein